MFSCLTKLVNHTGSVFGENKIKEISQAHYHKNIAIVIRIASYFTKNIEEVEEEEEELY